MLRIDDSRIDVGGWGVFGGRHVPLARAVAALAADREAIEYRLFVAVGETFHGTHAVGMAKEALGRNWPARAPIGSVTRGDVPNLFLAEPTHRSLEQVA